MVDKYDFQGLDLRQTVVLDNLISKNNFEIVYHFLKNHKDDFSLSLAILSDYVGYPSLLKQNISPDILDDLLKYAAGLRIIRDLSHPISNLTSLSISESLVLEDLFDLKIQERGERPGEGKDALLSFLQNRFKNVKTDDEYKTLLFTRLAWIPTKLIDDSDSIKNIENKCINYLSQESSENGILLPTIFKDKFDDLDSYCTYLDKQLEKTQSNKMKKQLLYWQTHTFRELNKKKEAFASLIKLISLSEIGGIKVIKKNTMFYSRLINENADLIMPYINNPEKLVWIGDQSELNDFAKYKFYAKAEKRSQDSDLESAEDPIALKLKLANAAIDTNRFLKGSKIFTELLKRNLDVKVYNNVLQRQWSRDGIQTFISRLEDAKLNKHLQPLGAKFGKDDKVDEADLFYGAAIKHIADPKRQAELSFERYRWCDDFKFLETALTGDPENEEYLNEAKNLIDKEDASENRILNRILLIAGAPYSFWSDVADLLHPGDDVSEVDKWARIKKSDSVLIEKCEPHPRRDKDEWETKQCDLLGNHAHWYYKQKMYSNALKDYSTYLKYVSTKPNTYYFKGFCEDELEDLEAALNSFSEFVKKVDRRTRRVYDAWIRIIELKEELRHIYSPINRSSTIDTFIHKFQDEPLPRFHKAKLAEKERNYSQADKSYSKATEKKGERTWRFYDGSIDDKLPIAHENLKIKFVDFLINAATDDQNGIKTCGEALSKCHALPDIEYYMWAPLEKKADILAKLGKDLRSIKTLSAAYNVVINPEHRDKNKGFKSRIKRLENSIDNWFEVIKNLPINPESLKICNSALKLCETDRFNKHQWRVYEKQGDVRKHQGNNLVEKNRKLASQRYDTAIHKYSEAWYRCPEAEADDMYEQIILGLENYEKVAGGKNAKKLRRKLVKEYYGLIKYEEFEDAIPWWRFREKRRIKKKLKNEKQQADADMLRESVNRWHRKNK